MASRQFTRALHAALKQCKPSSSVLPVASRPASCSTSRIPSRGITSSAFRAASSVGGASTTDPRDAEVEQLLLKGIEAMANSDLDGASQAYTRSLQIKETPAALYNLALAQYQLGQLPQSIESFERSLELQPSADAHTNVASAYILSTPPNAYKAIDHLQKALALTPDDGEICFNMGVIFEASDRLDDALREYQRAQELGIDRADQCIRNVGGKIVERKRVAAAASDESKTEA